MDVAAIASIVAVVLSASVALFTTVANRGKTRAEEDVLAVKASTAALESIQRGLGQEIERLNTEVNELRATLVQIQDELRSVSRERDQVRDENARLHREINELRRRIAQLESQ